MAYSKTTDTKERNKADLVLADKAWERVKASDSSLGERLAAYGVTNAMKLKAKLGAGVRRRRRRSKKRVVGAGIRRKTRVTRRRKTRVVPRVLAVPKTGGKLKTVLRTIGVAPGSIAPTVKKIRAAVGKKSMKLGEGLYLRPFKTGYGLYLRPFRRNLN